MGGGGPDAFAEAVAQARARRGAPRGARAARARRRSATSRSATAPRQARAALGDYYGFLGEYAERVIAGRGDGRGRDPRAVAAFEQAGVDEVICFPTSSDPAQVDLLARAVLTQPTSSAGTG